ncbi:tolB protein precursor protein [Enhygromyxa salina]|uniref:TolB protein protein n=1 Tax=Enhygromyxa salina TaxID=215803 RepID=A0A0C1ZTV8_9BACT|nr:LpqB family beta-propeller domain-containing protein [Enhygromyxa salina]KIG14488.1 tolB protein precursor protein [Enhygromyxa salina]
MTRNRLVMLALLTAWVGSACFKPSADQPGAQAAAKADAGKPGSPVEQPETEELCGRVLFVASSADHHGPDQIWQVPAAGGPSTQLLRSGASVFPAAISPDARSLLVLRSEPQPDGKTHDRFGLLALTGEADAGPAALAAAIGPKDAGLRNPSWSPDGSWIVFESDANSFRDLYRLGLGSDTLLRLTDNAEGNFEPVVSPDGQRIAFVSSRDGNAEIYVMTADGGAPTRVTNSPGDDSAPVWSPDGQSLAFCSARARERGVDAFVTNLEGTNVQPALREGALEQSVIVSGLAYSPDGSLLAYTELVPKGGVASIVIVRAATGELVARTGTAGTKTVDEQPSWSPDGKHLVFARSQDQRSDIARVRADGSGLELLTDGAGLYWLPRWVADPGCDRVAPLVVPVAGQG